MFSHVLAKKVTIKSITIGIPFLDKAFDVHVLLFNEVIFGTTVGRFNCSKPTIA